MKHDNSSLSSDLVVHAGAATMPVALHLSGAKALVEGPVFAQEFRVVPLSDMPSGVALPQVVGIARLDTKQSIPHPLDFRMSQYFPPGKYRFRVEAMGFVSDPFDVLVPRSEGYSIQPGTLGVRGKAGSTAKGDFALHNVGNVPLSLDRSLLLRLCEDGGTDAAFARAFAALAAESRPDNQRPTADDVLGEIAQQLGANVVGLVRVQLTAEKRTVAPGAQAAVSYELTIPPDGRPGRHYSGVAQGDDIKVRFHLTVQSHESES